MKTFTIRDVATISGLPASTLRYYERIGLIEKIARDESSKQRVFSQQDVDLIAMIASLSATGMSIENMRRYLGNRLHGPQKATEQADLLMQRKRQLEIELHELQLRAKYVDAKIAYWKAVEAGDSDAINQCTAATHAIADEMKLPRISGKQD